MKRTLVKPLVGCLAAVLVVGFAAVPAMAAAIPASQSWNRSQQTTASYIGEAKAKDIALKHAGVDETQVSWIFVKQDYEHGQMEYDVEFFSGNKEYDYEIDAVSGTILSFDSDVEWYMDAGNSVAQSSTDIGLEKAKSIALNHAGVAAADVAFIYAKLDYDDGLRVYDVEFSSGNKEYDYEINAATGDIISNDQDIEWYAAGGDSAPQSSTDIGTEKAKSIALGHAGVAAADTAFIYARLDYDDGLRVYDVEFFSGNKEYDYKIDAASGTVLGSDFDIEWYTIPTTQGDYIGETKVKQIVEQAAGATGVFTELKLETDDGRVLYEGEMRSGRTEYEFEIDAVTGTIVDWDADWD